MQQVKDIWLMGAQQSHESFSQCAAQPRLVTGAGNGSQNLGRVEERPDTASTRKGTLKSFLDERRCFLCNDVMIPKPFQPTKLQRTCAMCKSTACGDCYRRLTPHDPSANGRRKSIHGSVFAAVVSTKALVFTCSRCKDVTCKAVQRRRAAVVLRGLFAPCNWYGQEPCLLNTPVSTGTARRRSKCATLWSIICSYAFEPSGAAAFIAVLLPPRTCSTTFSSLRCASPPNTRDTAESDAAHDGSPKARIPDFSEALHQTGGRVLSALSCNSPNRPSTHRQAVSAKKELPLKVSQVKKGASHHAASPSQPSATPRQTPSRAGLSARPQFLDVPQSSRGPTSSRMPTGKFSVSPIANRSAQPTPSRAGARCPASSVSPMVVRQIFKQKEDVADRSPSAFTRTDSCTVSLLMSSFE